MRRLLRAAALAALAVGLFAASGCGDDPSATAEGPSASAAPIAELQALAQRFRASNGETEAWWVQVSEADADRLVGETADSSPQPDESDTTYVVILRGAFHGGDGKPYDWAVIHSYANAEQSGTTAHVTNTRPDTRGHEWNPLDLPSD
jgi:hypothetical protein